MSDTLIAYFSMKGQTIGPGMKIINVEKDNTAYVAEFIKDVVGGDLYEIKTKKKYSPDHMKLIYEAKDEIERGERPELIDLPESIARYDTVFLGYPNWWATLPMPVVSFLEHYDWTGKRVIAFCTSEGSGFSHSVDDIKKHCKGANVEKGIHIIGSTAAAAREQVTAWAKKIIL